LPFNIAHEEGNIFWATDYDAGKIYKLNVTNENIANGTIITDTINAPDGVGITGIAVDGDYLWVAHCDNGGQGTNGSIYRLDKSGNVIESFLSPKGCVYGLAYDGTYLWADEWNGSLIYKLGVNHKPILDPIQNITINEGNLFDINPLLNSNDLDGDSVNISVNNIALDSNGQWQTDYNSAGDYIINVVASDGVLEDSETFNLKVLNVNQPSVLNTIQNITATEGDLVTITSTATDPDNDTLTYTYSVPLNSNGQWQTSIGNIGIYNATVTVSDGTDSVSQNVTITVNAILPPVSSPAPSGGSGGGGPSGGSGGSTITNLGELQSLKEIETRVGAEIKFKIGDTDYSFKVVSATKDSLTIMLDGVSYTIKVGEAFTMPLANTQNKDVAFTFNNLDFGDISLSLEAVEGRKRNRN